MDQQSELTAEIPQSWVRPAVVFPVLACLALVGGQLPSFSPQANLYTLGTGGLLIWLGLSNRMPRRPAPVRLRRGALWWSLPVGVFVVFEATTFLFGATDYPTLSRLADPLLEDKMIRSVGYFTWLAAFWALVRR